MQNERIGLLRFLLSLAILKSENLHFSLRCKGDFMQEKDIVSMEYFEDPARFADLLNVFLFRGKQIIKPEEVKEANRSVSGRVFAEGEVKAYQLFRDIFRRVSCRMHILLVAIENQSGIHYAMPVRVLNAEGAAYAGQVKTREKFHREQKDLTGDEFVSGFARNDKLQPFITLVLYYGTKEWDGPKCLKDMLDLSEFPQGVAEMVQDYSLNLLEIRKYPYLERFQTDIRYVFGFLQNAEDKEKLIAYMRENSETFSKLDEEAYDLIAVMSKTSQLKQLKKICRNEGGTDMCKAIDDMIEDGKKEGIALTKQVFKMNSEGKNPQEIAEQCLISLEEVQLILE